MQSKLNAIRTRLILLNNPLMFGHKFSHLNSINLSIYTKRLFYSNINISVMEVEVRENISTWSYGKKSVMQSMLLEAIATALQIQEIVNLRSLQWIVTRVSPELRTASSANSTFLTAEALSKTAMKVVVHDICTFSSSLLNGSLIQGGNPSYLPYSLLHG